MNRFITNAKAYEAKKEMIKEGVAEREQPGMK